MNKWQKQTRSLWGLLSYLFEFCVCLAKLNVLHLLDEIHVLELIRALRERVQQFRFALIRLVVEHLQLVGQALCLLGSQHLGVVLATHQHNTLVLLLRVVHQGEALGRVLVVHLVGQQGSEVHRVGGELQHEELEALAAWQRQQEYGMLLGTGCQCLVLRCGQRGSQHILCLVVLDPNLRDLLGILVRNQLQLHNVGELLVR